MLNAKEISSNISHQIINRETNCNRHPKAFAADIFRERFRVAKNLYKTDLRGHFGCVNAIEFSHGGQFLASGGDDKRVLVWDVEKSLAEISTPRPLATEQASNIFCLGFDSKNRKLISGGNDTLAISHDFETGKLDNVFKHDGPVYGLSIDPQNDNVFATASENGEISLFDQRSTTPTVIASVASSFHAVEFHPNRANLLVTANSKRGATLYDIRKPKQPVLQYSNLENPRSCMSVRFNRTGNLILGLRRRLPPILYNVNSPNPICTFYHPNYYNSCTMKSCTFAGEDDELVISGSDDFNLYVWRLSGLDLEATDSTHNLTQMVLYGHRSIVNQVRYNRQKCLLASSGVEKIIKIWSPFSQHNWSGSLTEEASCSDNPRELYSPYNLFTMALPENWHHLSHDYSSENTNEDPRMMAFFDSLIQQEIEEWETNSSTEESHQEDRSISSFFSCGSTSSSSSSNSSSNSGSSSSSSCSSDSDSDNENNNELRRNKKHCKRKAVAGVKIQRKQRNIKPNLATIKLNQQQKQTNRIAYLIAKKRKTLRRLAMKGTSLNKRSKRLTVIVNGRNRTTNLNKRQHQKSSRRKQSRKSHTTNSAINDRPTTSAAAAALAESSRLQCNTQNKKIKSDLNDFSEEDSGNIATSSSSRSNALNSSFSSINNNIANVPSTSTGITSNFRDAFLRLSRQIFMSDSEDDDHDNHTDDIVQKQNNNNSRNREMNDKKLNGVNKRKSDGSIEESRTNLTRSSRSNQRPRNSAALNVINTNETVLPQKNHLTNDKVSLKNTRNDDDDADIDCNLKKTTSPHKAAAVRNGNAVKSPKIRRCTVTDIVEDSPTTSSRNSNISFRNDVFSEEITSSVSISSVSVKASSSSSKTNRNCTQTESPLKKRKASIDDYIKVQNHFNNEILPNHLYENNYEVGNDEDLNNNETNNNDIFSIDENASNNGQLTPQRPNLNNIARNNLDNFDYTLPSSQHNNMISYMFTPDSGVSLNNSTTPSTIDHNDIQASTSNSARVATTYLSTCYEQNDCDVKNINENNNDDDDDEGVVVINNRKTNLNQFQQKVARVRRNYRKQFFDDTDSD